MKINRKAFTLIELLTVIAIIGILAAIIIPTVGSVQVSAKKSKTKAQFSQWSAAVELFKHEYGFYPRISADVGSGLVDSTNFLANLTGRSYTGTKLTGGGLVDNRKGLSFYSAADSDLAKNAEGVAQNIIVDAFGNSEIMVMIDMDGDGIINNAERESTKLAGGNSADPSTESAALGSGTVDAGTIRAGVAFYSAGRNQNINDYVYTWK